ncbi:MAG: signal peptidase I [Bacilli bacterium]|nr:signal peptidase I [Bacilli bacterium]
MENNEFKEELNEELVEDTNLESLEILPTIEVEYTKEDIKKSKRRFLVLLLSFLISVVVYYISKAFDPFKGVEVGTRFQSSNLGLIVNVVMICSIFVTIFGIIVCFINRFKHNLKIKKKQLTKIFDILEWVVIFPVCIAVASFCFSFIFTLTVVEGESMEPNYFDNEELFLLYTNNFDRFDVVVIDVNNKYGLTNEKLFIKRVIGLPGEHIEYIEEEVNGKLVTNLYVNGEFVEEDFYTDFLKSIYLTYTHTEKSFDTEKVYSLNGLELKYVDGKVVIPDDYYLVLGDNRINSTDSRVIGLVHKDDIIGEIKFKVKSLID